VKPTREVSFNKFEVAIFELDKMYLDKIYMRWLRGRGAFAYLDYATGTGRILAVFDNKTTVKFAVDSSSVQLALAKAKVPRAICISNNIVTNPHCLPIRFDLITCFRLLLNLGSENHLPVLQVSPRLSNPIVY
jgi:ubiquinone/menaquinone biosynthesis C-methylase UbiE